VVEKEGRIKMLENLFQHCPPLTPSLLVQRAPAACAIYLCKLSKGRKNSTVQDIKKKNTFSLTDKLSSTFTQFKESKWARHIVNLEQRKGKTFFRNKFNDG
jgi:hypothetical protein